MAWKDRLKGGTADRLTPDAFSRQALLSGRRHEHEHTHSQHMATEIAMDHLAEDPRYYEKLEKMERTNPSTSRRQQRFMCADYGQKKRGQPTRTGMSLRQLREYCQRRIKNAPATDRAIFRRTQLRRLVLQAMDTYGMGVTAALAFVKRKLMTDPEVHQLTTNLRFGVAHMRGKNPKKRRTKNPHLTSGKWRFLGMFEKRDIKQVKRILRVHGMKTKVTKDHLKGEPGMRELYVERGAFDTAYRAITRLFISEKNMDVA